MMKNLIKTFVFVLITLVIGVIGIRWFPDEGQQRYLKCQKIRTKISKQELISLLGPPYSIEKKEKGIAYYFGAGFAAAGPIRVMLDVQENLVVGSKCDEDIAWKWF